MGGPKDYKIIFDYGEIKNSKSNIILLGEVGSGKTTLMNKLTNSNFETGKDCPSITSEVQISSSLDYSSIIFDFPGFKVTENVIPIFKVQYKTIRNIPIKAICFVVERRVRPELIVDTLKGLKEAFDDYFDNIIIIITKSEGLEHSTKFLYENKIYGCTKFKKIIFSDSHTSGEEILYQINNFTHNMKVLKEVEPKSREFVKSFTRATENNMKKYRKEYTEEFEDTLIIFNEKFNLPTTDKALKRALFFALKDYKNNLIEQFYEVAKKEQYISDQVLEHVLSFSNEIYSDFENFREKAEKEMDLILTNYEGETNRFKKCPYCGLIWFKISGCDGVTRCGTRDSIKDKFYGYYKDYIVKYENNQLTIINNDFKFS